MTCNFRVGQKVVCIDSDDYGVTIEGKVYTIASVMPRGRSDRDGAICPGITLHEVPPPTPHHGFDSRRFRPVVERKTDISVFKSMLTPSKARELAQ